MERRERLPAWILLIEVSVTAGLVEISNSLLYCVLCCPSCILLFNQASLQPNTTVSKVEREKKEMKRDIPLVVSLQLLQGVDVGLELISFLPFA